MKRATKLLMVLGFGIAILSANAFAVETTVKGTIFADWMMNLRQGAKNYNVFTIDRAYLGIETKLSDYTFMRITLTSGRKDSSHHQLRFEIPQVIQ